MSADTLLHSVVVTGGCGFMGHHLVAGILEAEPGCRVAVLDLDVSHNRVQGAEYFECDISNKPAFQSVLRNLDPPPLVVFHAAVCPYHVKDEGLSWRVNADGTRKVLESVQELGGVKALIYTSSSSVVHDNDSDLVDADESLPLLKPPQQKLTYTLTKAIAEEHVVGANRKAGILTAVVRPCTMFGPGNDDFLGRIVGVVRAGKAKYRMGSPENQYDFLYVANCIHAELLLARKLLQEADCSAPVVAGSSAAGEAFNITNEQRINFWDVTLIVAEKLGRPVDPKEIIEIPMWLAYFIALSAEWLVWFFSGGRKRSNMTVDGIRWLYRNRTLNDAKAKRILGYRPIYTLGEGLDASLQTFIQEEKKKTR